MGVSTDALLVYGYVWEEEADLFDDESGEREWTEIVARLRGIPNPWDQYPEAELAALPYAEQRARGNEWTAAHRAELDAWRDAKKAIEAEYGIDVDYHGSDEWSVPIVKIAGAGKRAARGYPQELAGTDLAVDPEWDGRLRRFVTDLAIDTSEAKGPGWFLVSWWG